jgi:hypothetical protein
VSLHRRLEKLEARSPAREVGRLFFLLPDLWPAADRTALETLGGDAFDELIERRTGVRPVRETGRIWAIITHASDDMRAWDEATKAAFLEGHETRPLAPWQRRERSCG